MPYFALAERRLRARYPSDGLVVSVRKKGGLLNLQGLAADFNRHGIALLLNQALSKDSKVFISLGLGEIQIQNVVGIVHNCVALPEGYRCGIQFRTASNQQMEQTETNVRLRMLEEHFIAAEATAS